MTQNSTHAVQQLKNLRNIPGGARIIVVPDASMSGINVAPFGGISQNDMNILQTAKAMNLPLLTVNKAMVNQVKSHLPFRALWGQGQVQIIVL